MRTIRIYQPGNYACGHNLELSPEASHHVAVVLRMQVGEGFILFADSNQEFSVAIASISKKKVVVQVESVKTISRESPLSIHLAQCISKGERMEWVVQKAVELGVCSITPIISQHVAVKLDKDRLEKKIASWQAIAVGACQQSGRNWVPRVHKPLGLGEWLAKEDSALKLVLDPEANSSWPDLSLSISSLSLLVGPEGGLSVEEVSQARSCGFQSIALGPRVLRTETAAICALSVLQALGGDLR